MSEPLWALLLERGIGLAERLWDRFFNHPAKPVKPAVPTNRRTNVAVPPPLPPRDEPPTAKRRSLRPPRGQA